MKTSPHFRWLLLLLLILAIPLRASAGTPDMLGKAGWTAVMYGTGKDPQGDSQAGAADTDIIADAIHGSLYVGFSDSGTTSTTDDYLYFRLRIDNPTATNNFAGVAVVGMDADGDGDIDIFMTVDGRNSSQFVRLMDPGTDANISPSTTSTAPLPAGWLPNNGFYPFTASNYAVVGVTNTTDPHWNSNFDLGLDGKQDAFVSWRIPLSDMATVLAIPSPVDRNGNYGPRGATGIAGYDQNTTVRYVSFTQTQNGPINGDLLGVGASYDKNATFASLGTFTAPMSASNPVSAGPGIIITEPISGGVINDAEDNSVSISGTSSYLDGATLTLTVTDGTTTVTGTTTVLAGGAWTVSGLDLSGLDEGTLTVTATADPFSDGDPTNDVSDTATVEHDKTPPTVTIDQLATTTAGTPTLTGTSDLPDGSLITIAIDPDNNTGTANLTYQVVLSGGVWTLDTATVSPVSGTFPSSGLTAYAKITATATDASGNTATATSLNRPTVNNKSTNDTTPALSGNWTYIVGDVLTITVSGATYTLSPSGNTWTVDLGTATPSSGSLTPLVAGNTYEVVATVTRSTSVSDTTSNELTITLDPVKDISIDGGPTATSSDTTPTITGTSQNSGGFVIVRLDPNNDGDLSDAVTFSVTPDGGGNWTLDTGTATPISGTKPVGGFIGDNGVLATDSTGAVSDTQVLTVTVPTITISSITSTATTDGFGVVNPANKTAAGSWLNITEDDAVTIAGTATDGFTVDVVVSDANGHSVSASGVAVTSGNWSAAGLNLSSLDNTALTVTATLTSTSVSATNTSVTHDEIAPIIFITAQDPIKKTAAVITGRTDLPVGTLLTVEIYDGVTLKAQWTSITNDSLGYFTTSGVTPNTGSENVGNNTPLTVNVYTTTANTTDTAGNITQTATKSINTAPSASVNSISITNITGSLPGDGLIEVAEIGSGVTVSGSLTLSGTGTMTLTVTDGTTTVTKNSVSYSGNTWSTTLTTSEIQSLQNGQLTFTATVVDAGFTLTDAAFATLNLATPTLAITDDTPGVATGDVIFTFTFSEAVTGFDATDITVANGTKGTFSGSGDTYTLVVTPTASSSGDITVSVASSVAAGANTGRGNTAASATQPFDTTGAAAPPTITIDTSALVTDTTPLITGTCSLQPGAPIVIEIDTDNDGITDLTYSATVQSGGTWSLDIATATPVSGTLTEAGLDPWARITATAENSYGNSTTVTGLNTPTVTSLSTNTFTPTLTGYWTQVTGDTLTVVANGTTYTAGDGNLSVTATNWSLVIPGGGAYGSDGTYSIAATVTRASPSSTATDLTSNELVIDTSATVTISGGATANITGDPTPVISGTSTGLPAGTVLTLSLDTDNNGSFDLVYKTTVDGSGNWSVDTGTAIPYSGTFPSAGLTGPVPLSASATDPAGNTGTDTQTLTVDTSASITITTNAKTSDTTPLITGTTDIEEGGTISVTISGATYDVIVGSGGNWSVDLGTATPTSGTLTPLVNGNTYTITASGTDAQGNFATTSKPLTIDTNAPVVTVTEPIDSIASGGDADGTLNATEDDNVVITGTTANVPDGSTLYVTISDGTTTISDTTTVTSGVWSLAALNLSGLANGLITVTATYIDDTGTAYSDTGTVLHDKTLAAGSVSIDSITQDTGTLSDFITKDNTLIFTGSANASATVTLTLTGPSGNFAGVNVTADTSGVWTYNYTGTTLSDGTYTLQAVNISTVQSNIVIDATAPAGPVTVDTQTTSDTTPIITGTATLGAGENLSVTVNGVTYTVGDGNLTYNSGTETWSLTIPTGDALTPANAGGGFNGVYNVTATITDTAGNTLADSGTGELTVTDTTLPVIDLDPSDGGTVNRTVSTQQGTAVSLDDNADPATVVEASDKLTTIDITVGGLLDGASEKLIFGSTTVAANGSSGTQSDITVGGVRINVTYAGGVFTLQKYDFTALTAAEAEAIIRDIQYQDTAGPVTPGNRTFAFATTDDAGNTSASATSTVLVVGPIDHYDVTANSPQTAGVAFTTTVTAKDSLGNTVTSDSSTVVTMTSSGSAQFDSDGNGTFGDVTKTLVNGTFTISTKDTVAETITLTATDSTPKTGTSGNVVINAAAANKLAFVQAPTDGSINTVLSPAVTVQVQDAFGNSVAGAGVSVAMILNSGTGSMNGTTPQLTDAGGLATFNDLSFTATGSKTIQASSSGLSSALSGAFTIYTATLTPATGGSAISADTAATGGTGAYTTLTGPVYAEQLAGQTGTGTIVLNAPSGFEFNPAATVTVGVTGTGTLVGLASGTATVTASTITITVSSVSSGGTSTLTWSGIEVRPTVGNPLASGNITKTGTSTMVAIQNGVTNFGTLGEVPGAATNLVIDTQPSSTATVGTVFAQQPVIRIEDQFGNVVTGYSGTVTATRNAGSGTLGGTTTVTVSSGIATFSNLYHDTASTITLDFTAAGLTTATSDTITVTGGVVTANSGTNYWLAMPGNFNYATPSLSLLITGARTTTGTVSIPGLGFSANFNLTANSYTTVTLPTTASVNPEDGVTNLGINVTAADDVTVHGANLLKYTSDGYLALGANALGTEYIALGQKNGGSIQGSQLTVVASEDGTTVTITPSVTTGSRTAGTPYAVSLDSGDVYQLRNTNNSTSADLSGTIITADKAVGVYGGHQAGNVPVAMGAADHLVEMLTPVSAWGKRFFAAPLKTRTGYTLRLAASVTGTTVTTNGVSIGAALTRGEVREMILSDEVELVASAPVEVAQYAQGQSYDNATGDPAMLLISPQEQYLGGYEFTAPSGYDSYVTLVSPAAGVGSVTVDGTAVAGGDFTAIGASGYSYARVSVSAGAHQLGGTRPFGAGVYGWAANEGYAYPAGMNAAPVGSVSGFALSPATANNAIGAEHCLSATVTNAGSALQFDGVDDYVEVADSASLNSYVTSGTLTIEYWINPGAPTATYRDVLAKRPAGNNGGFLVEAGPNSLNYDHYIYTSAGWKTLSVSYTANTWQHIAFVAQAGGTIEVFKDGVSQGTTSLAGVSFTSTSQFLRFMANSQATEFYQNGSLDEVRFWNVARTQAQIQGARNQRLTGSEAGLVGYWRFDDGAGATATDTTANNNPGTLINGPTWATAGAVGIPLEGVRVDFSVAGNNTRSTFVYSDANGLANYCYTDNSGAIGSDTITAQIGTASQTATANWGTAGAPTISGLSSVSVTLLPAESSKLQSLSATINDSNTGSVTVTWKVDGVVQQSGPVSSGTADSFDYVYAVGTHDVVVTVDDGTGNVSSLAITVTVLDTTAPTITLSGSNPLTNNLNVAYSEPGYTASDVAAGDLTGSVTVSGTVDTSTVGTYQLTYSVVDSDGNTASVTRTVRVVDPGNPVVTRADTTGTDYWLAFPGNVNTYTRTLNLLINSPYNTFGTVEVAGLGFSTNFTLSAGAGVTITVPNGASVNTLDGTTNLGIHVTAQDEVTVHGANLEEYTGDGYLGLPTDALGTEYIVLSQKNGGAVASVQGSQLTVVASENSTTVTITPSVATGSRAAGTPYTVSLSQGEVYQLRNTNNTTSDDLSGTIVTADKPVGVFGGNRAGYVPTTNAAADHLVEMLTPVETWGTLFFTAPLASRTGYTVRLVASENGTTVTTNGVSIGTSLARGAVHEMILTNATVLQADKPVEVAQYAHGAAFDKATGDPFMMLISPVEQYVADYRVTVPSGYANYVTLISPSSEVGTVTVDGTAVGSGNFTAIGGSGYSYAQVGVSAGAHHFSGSLPGAPAVYGWTNNASYGYPAGMNLAPLTGVDVVSLTPVNATKVNGTSHTVTATVGSAGHALQFDGVDDYVEATDSSISSYATTGELTIEYWINPAPANASIRDALGKRPDSNDAGFAVEANANSLTYQHFVNTSGGWQYVSVDYTANTWQHIAIVAKAGNSLEVFKDGVSQGSVSLAGVTLVADSTALRLMANTMTGYERHQGGMMDEVRIWNVARSATQILAAMNLRLTGSETGLAALWRMDEGTGTTVADATANGNNGTLFNGIANSPAADGTANGPIWITSPVVPAVPVAGVRVDFTVTGVNSRVGSSFTDANGQTSIIYTDSTGNGTDTITGTVGAVSGTATVTWGP